MDRKKVSEKDGKVFRLDNVECNGDIDEDYKIKCNPNEKISPCGHLPIGELISCKEGEPEFTFRWDEKEGALDTDTSSIWYFSKIIFTIFWPVIPFSVFILYCAHIAKIIIGISKKKVESKNIL